MNSYVALSMAAAASFVVTWALGYALIPWLNRLKFGQVISLSDAVRHGSKKAAPAMGGIMFIAGILASVAVTLATDRIMGGDISASGSLLPSEARSKLFGGILAAVALGLIGFADDYIKTVLKRNLGLTEKQKSAAVAMVCIAFLTSLYLSMGRTPYTFIPFVGNVELGMFFWPFGFCVIYAAIYAVNLTDGTDGLCSGVTAAAASALSDRGYERHARSGRRFGGCRGRVRRVPCLEPLSRKGVNGRHRLNVPRRNDSCCVLRA
jgi:phospho-N-acetylmuramoyl-pentapeptide-transferase